MYLVGASWVICPNLPGSTHVIKLLPAMKENALKYILHSFFGWFLMFSFGGDPLTYTYLTLLWLKWQNSSFDSFNRGPRKGGEKLSSVFQIPIGISFWHHCGSCKLLIQFWNLGKYPLQHTTKFVLQSSLSIKSFTCIDRSHMTSPLKSKTKEPLKFLSSWGIRGGIFISVYNFTAPWHASFGSQSILNFRVMAECDIKLRSHLSKNIYLSHDL